MVQQLNGVSTIVIEKVDRLARDLGVQEWIMRDLKQRGVTLVSATEQDLDADPTRVMFRQIMGAIAQYDRAMTVLKLRAARKRMKVATGRCEGRKPFGTRAGEADVIHRARELRTAGATYTAIADKFNTEGVPTRYAGRRWFPATVAKILRRSV
jgi:DNA invertase Pin-like site-specific DNA recombinase